MKAVLIDDEQKREQIQQVRKLLKKLRVEVPIEFEFLGQIGVEVFKKRIASIDAPPDLAIVDYKLGWKDIRDVEWNGDAIANHLRTRWPGHTIHIIFVSSYLRGADSPYDILRDLVQAPMCSYVEFTGDWESKFEAQILGAYSAVGYQPPAYLNASDRPLVEAFREAAHELSAIRLVGESSRFLDALLLASKASCQDLTIMISGEHGVGKETLARAIHANSASRHSSFELVQCSDLSTDDSSNAILNALTTAGTTFLNDFERLPSTHQIMLSRAIQTGSIARPRSKQARICSRLISATTKSQAEIVDGGFHRNLLRAITEFPIALPSLSDRRSDIPSLAAHFLNEIGLKENRTRKFTLKAISQLRARDWPDNLDDLERAVRIATVDAGPSNDIQVTHLPAPPRAIGWTPDGDTLQHVKRSKEIETILDALSRTSGNITKAASLLGIERETLSRKIKKYDLKG
jgi:transcriptional regulator with AAA-type ATPase domain